MTCAPRARRPTPPSRRWTADRRTRHRGGRPLTPNAAFTRKYAGAPCDGDRTARGHDVRSPVMADLQDDLHTAAEVGRADEPYPQEAVVVGPEEYRPVSDPDDAPLDRARAVLAAHPVCDGYSGLPWTLRGLPWYDLDLGSPPSTPTCRGCARGRSAPCSGRCTCPTATTADGRSPRPWSSWTWPRGRRRPRGGAAARPHRRGGRRRPQLRPGRRAVRPRGRARPR